ncbi:hypothetical protein J4462_03625 [Candidatus Pacearchaeota archaeon]|nr:hypothetical protein [Candidatus Pacearchaeota archaeon]
MRSTPEFKKKVEQKQAVQKMTSKTTVIKPIAPTKTRNKLLSFWLYLTLILNALILILALFMSDSITKYLPTAPRGIVYLFSFLSFLNVVFVIYLFRWKLWAFWGFTIVAIMNVIVSLIYGYGTGSLFYLLGPIVLWLIMRPKWELFD